LQIGFQWRVGGDFSRHSVCMADVVPVDRAPALSGWARAWIHVAAVIILNAAGAASVAPKGSTDCPLMRVFEAAAPATTSPTIFYDVAPAQAVKRNRHQTLRLECTLVLVLHSRLSWTAVTGY
jgi:hypothetical protein